MDSKVEKKQGKGLFGMLSARDFTASIVVFLVALPLCMGISIASGVPPALGLISGIIGGLIVGFLAGSPLQVSGPAAGLAVIVWELVNKFGLKALGAIVLVAGLIQLAAGAFKVGRWFRAVSPSVIHGMLAGIGVLIFASQFHVMVGDKPGGSGLWNLLSIPAAVWKGLFPMDWSKFHTSAFIGVLTITVLVLWAAFRPKKLYFLPGPLLAIIVTVIVAAVFFGNINISYIDVPSNLLQSANIPNSSSFALLLRPDVIMAAIAMAVVASAESLLCASAVDQMHQGVRTNYDKELMAQGVGNIVAGVLGALPITGVIVRSSANVEAGATNRSSAILHGVWLLAFIVSMPFILKLIPTSALAAILVYIGYKLLNIKMMRELWSTSRSEFGIYLATLVSIVSIDLLSGVMIGVALSLFKIVYVFSHLDILVENDVAGNRYDVYIEGSATFIKLPNLAEKLEELPRDAEIHIHLGELSYVDHACIELFDSWSKQILDSGGVLVLEWDTLHRRSQSKPLMRSGKESQEEKEGSEEVNANVAQRAAT